MRELALKESSGVARRAFVLELLIGALLYFLAARVGLELAYIAKQVSGVWPGTGFALALLVLRGRKLWPAVSVGAFAASLTTDAPSAAAAGIAVGNTLEALVGATLLARVGFEPALRRLRDVAALFIIGACVSTLFSATLGVISLCLTGAAAWSAFGPLWSTWWIGDAISNLIVAPFILVWADQVGRGLRVNRVGEAVLLIGALVFLSAIVFVEHRGLALYPVHYLVFPAIIWAAVRLGQHATASLALGGSIITVLATVWGRGPFVAQSMLASLLQVEIFMGTVAATGLFLGAATAERNRAERRRAADYARLQSSEERLALALAAGRMGAWDWDIETDEIRLTEPCEALLGLAPGAFGGTLEALRGLIHPEDSERVIHSLREAVRRLADFNVEFRNVRPDGSLYWIAATAQVIARNGRAARMVGICRDVTERKVISDELALQARELAAADRRKDEFLAVLSHELRNPLAPLQNAVALLARGDSGSRLVQAREIMERQLHHLVRLVDDLLDVARIRSGKIILARERVQLAGLVSSAVEMARSSIDLRRHQLEVTLPREPVWLDADRTRIPQLLANLLNNAAKYMDEGGRIWLTAAVAHGEAIVRVRDTGIGMTPDALANVFELFAQAAGPAHAVQGGLGVGLSLSRTIAELHGGLLTAHSDGPGRGSEFTLRLPTASEPTQASTPADPDPRTTARRVLIADDNVDAAESLGMLLNYGGHEVRLAYSGRDALAAAREFAPDVMILDLGMPGMDGYAVARAVRADPTLAAARLIALSGYGQAEDRRRSAAAGFDEHFVKPLQSDALDAAIARAPKLPRASE